MKTVWPYVLNLKSGSKYNGFVKIYAFVSYNPSSIFDRISIFANSILVISRRLYGSISPFSNLSKTSFTYLIWKDKSKKTIMQYYLWKIAPLSLRLSIIVLCALKVLQPGIPDGSTLIFEVELLGVG